VPDEDTTAAEQSLKNMAAKIVSTTRAECEGGV
jgi:hypothetical protein